MNESAANLGGVNARRVQTAALVISAAFVPLYIAGSSACGSTAVGVAFLLALYVDVLVALFTTVVLYRSERHKPFPQWRRVPYVTGIALLLALSVLPLATWPIAMSGITLHLRYAVFCMLGLNVLAAIVIWFGRGWSRLGLTVVAYWVLLLWLFPLAMGG
jgi:hypothetical protein